MVIPAMAMTRTHIPTRVLIQLAGFYHTSTDYILCVSDRRDPV